MANWSAPLRECVCKVREGIEKLTCCPGAPGGPLKPGAPCLVKLQNTSTTEEEKKIRDDHKGRQETILISVLCITTDEEQKQILLNTRQ